jgi:glycosyltransferase involved in cell wall biosynthesis
MINIEPTDLARAKNSRPLLSIIIPTHNRQQFAASAIRSVLAIPSNDIEVVVQDCSDDDQLSSLLAEESLDARLSYRHERSAYMTENWNRAIGRATGEYLCVIGDDDGVNPEIVQAAAWAKSNSLDCLAPKNNVEYRWPGTGTNSTLFSNFLKRPLPGSLMVYPFRGDLTTVVDLEAELRKLLRDGGVYFMHFSLPKLYYGLVHRRCLDAVRAQVGTYCKSVSPDMFLSLAIACTAPRMAVTDYPLTIPGVCKTSNSNVASILKKLSLRLEDQPEIRNTGYRWSEVVPPVYTVPGVWADAAVAALLSMGRGDLVKQLNLPRLAAYCVRADRGITQPVLRSLFSALRTTHKNSIIGAIKFAWNVLEIAAALQIDRIKRLLMTIRGKGRKRIDGLNNMVETSRALTNYLNVNGWSFTQRALATCSKDSQL